MTDERMITLLEEIRDLQRQQVENSTVALRNQQHSIDKQQGAIAGIIQSLTDSIGPALR